MNDDPMNHDPKIPGARLDRRGFVTTALASGFAASVLPVSAQTITTDATGLVAGEVKIPVGSGDMPAYRAMPAGGRRLATILVVHEVFGVHEHIKDVCRRFARLGYLAIAPELFARQGNAAGFTDVQALRRDLVDQVPDAQVLRDLDATLVWSRVNGGDRRRLARGAGLGDRRLSGSAARLLRRLPRHVSQGRRRRRVRTREVLAGPAGRGRLVTSPC